MSRKNILILKWPMDTVGGAEKVALELSAALSDYYNIHLVSLNSPLLEDVRVDPKVQFYQVPGVVTRQRYALVSKSLAVRKYIVQHKIDLVLGISYVVNAFGLIATAGTGVPFISCEHNSPAQNTYSKRLLRYLGAHFAHRVVTLTPRASELYKKLFKASDKKLLTIYNWYDKQVPLSSDLSAQKIVTVGRIDYQKGYEYLLEVAQRVFKERPTWSWEIFGGENPDYRLELQEKISQLGLEDKVLFKGVSSDYAEIYGDKSIYVMTSRYEGLPLVLLEALFAGLPIVSFDCDTGPADIVSDGVNGDLVDCFDVKAMSQRLAALMDDQSLRETYAKAEVSNLTKEKFSKETILEQWRDLIEETVAK